MRSLTDGRRRLTHLSVALLFLMESVGLNFTPAAANPTDVSSAFAEGLWTGEVIERLRSANDYSGLLTLVVLEESKIENPSITSVDLQATVQKALAATKDVRLPAIDRQLNAMNFREYVERLRNAGIITNNAENILLSELSPSTRFATEESAILPTTNVATLRAFDDFLRRHIKDAYEQSQADPNFATVIGSKLGSTVVPQATETLSQLASDSHIANGVLKDTITSLAINPTTPIDPAAVLTTSANGALKDTSNQLTSAAADLKTVADAVDQLQNPMASNAVVTAVQAANQLGKATSGDLNTIDVVQTVSNILPLPQDVRDVITRATEIGSTVASTVSTISDVASSISNIADIGQLGLSFFATGGIGPIAEGLTSALGFGGGGNAAVLDAIKNLSDDVHQMHQDMDRRFDNIDRQLHDLNEKIDQDFNTLNGEVVNGFNQVNGQLSDLSSSTKILESQVIALRDDVARAEINEFSLWEKDKQETLHTNLVTLLEDIRLADLQHRDIGQAEFDKLALYFIVVAKDNASESPLSGVLPAESYTFADAPERLADPLTNYPVNYVMSFVIDHKPLQSRLGGSIGNLDPHNVDESYTNERAWALAANALAAMIERWPQYAIDINPKYYEAIEQRGHDLHDLVAAVQREHPNDAFETLLDEYQKSSVAFAGDVSAALVDEITAYSNRRNLNSTQRLALVNGLHVDPRTGAEVEYPIGSVTVSRQCFGGPFSQTVSGSVLTGAAFRDITRALAMNLVSLDSCITHYEWVDSGTVRKQVNYYGLKSSTGNVYDGVCRADSNVSQVSSKVAVEFILRFPGEASAQTDAIIAESDATGAIIDKQGTIVNYPFWSGLPTEAGHNWNFECPQFWHIGDSDYNPDFNNTYYFAQSWPTVSTNLPPATETLFSTQTFALTNGLSALLRADKAYYGEETVIFQKLNADLANALALSSSGAATDITGPTITALQSDVRNMDGIRALLRSLADIGLQETTQRDDGLHGLLYGLQALPGSVEMAERAQLENTNNAAYDLSQAPLYRLRELRARLLIIRAKLAEDPTAFSDSHELVELTLERLEHSRCHVPITNGGKPTC